MRLISEHKLFWTCFIASLCGVCLIPLVLESEYFVKVVAYVIFWISMACCWNISCGYTGYVDFGPVVYCGIGAYSAAIAMTRFGIPFLPAVGIAGLVAMLVSLPMGLTTLRLRGAYFAIATFAFAETMKQVALEFDRTLNVSFFEGSHGITLPIAESANFIFFYCVLAVAVCVILVQFSIEYSKFGYGLKAIREAEDAAEIAGVNTTLVKLRAYATSALFLGMLGGIEAYCIRTFITPADVFNVHTTVQMVIMGLLGGLGTFFGPIVGGALLTIIYEVLGTTFVEYYLIMIGVIIIAIVLIMPQGIVGTIKAWKKLKFI